MWSCYAISLITEIDEERCWDNEMESELEYEWRMSTWGETAGSLIMNGQCILYPIPN